VFDLSLFAHSGDEIVLDLLPDISEKELSKILLQNKKTFAAQSADNLFTGILQKRIAQAVLKAAGCTDFAKSCAAYTAAELQRAAQTAKAMRFSVIGNEGFDRAQACLGGVYGGEIDEMTMRSKKQKNLWVCGEAIDLCGECGGYNLHFAFASGMIAGENL
ncbi:MAG: NAD(P)/FAD-dependent oxidoreductase, partial [Ruminococcus sp.]|nr:NAD(P)/FAD-dependent oxidoreductase [Ruminococcus sp.]